VEASIREGRHFPHDVLGHKTLAMVKRYSHLVVEHKAKVIEKMIAAKGLSRRHDAGFAGTVCTLGNGRSRPGTVMRVDGVDLRLADSLTTWLRGANKRADEFAFHQRRDCIYVDAFTREKLPRIVDAVDARGLNIDVIEARCAKLLHVVGFFKSASDAAHPQLHAARDGPQQEALSSPVVTRRAVSAYFS
jgi:hypothetical protein